MVRKRKEGEVILYHGFWVLYSEHYVKLGVYVALASRFKATYATEHYRGWHRVKVGVVDCVVYLVCTVSVWYVGEFSFVICELRCVVELVGKRRTLARFCIRIIVSRWKSSSVLRTARVEWNEPCNVVASSDYRLSY